MKRSFVLTRLSRSQLPFLCAGGAAAAAQIAKVASANTLAKPGLFVDDAYYYFGIARNVVAGRGSTWDGIHTTNGYHPLWMVIAIGVAAVFRSPFSPMPVFKGIAGLLWIGALREVATIARTLDASVAFAIGAIPIAIYAIAFPRSTPFAGVETGLLLPLLLIAIRCVVTSIDTATATRTSTTRFGALFALIALTRLDSLITVIAVAAYIAIRTNATLRTRLWSIARLIAAPVAVVAAIGIIDRAWLGNVLTVSSRAKALGGGSDQHYALEQYFTKPGTLPIIVGIGLVSGLIVAVAFVLTKWPRGRKHPSLGTKALSELLVVLWLAEFAATTLFDSQSSWPQWPWYFYNSFIILLLAPGLILHSLFAQRLRTPSRRVASSGPTKSIGSLIVIGAVVFGAVLGYLTAPQANGSENFYSQNARAALTLRKLLPHNAVLAMGDRAGAFGYLIERPVVQLEGIVNSHEFLDALERNRVADFLAQAHVGYYVKSSHLVDRYPLEKGGGPDVSTPECGFRFEPFFGAADKIMFTVCRSDIIYTSPIANGEQITVWRMTQRPQMFHMPKR